MAVDKEQKKQEAARERQAVKKMMDSEGAVYLKRFLEGQISVAQTGLISNRFTDLAEVVRLQERHKAFNDVLRYLNQG